MNTTHTPAGATATRTAKRPRARLLIAGAVVALALTGTTVAANADSSPQHAGAARSHQTTARHQHGGAQSPKAMADAWLRLWNGDYAMAPRVISPSIKVHAALLDGGDGSSIQGVQGFVDWIKQSRGAMPDLRFSTQIGPLIDGRYASLRWTATGTYTGGFPGAKAKPGTVITFTGTDSLRMRDGKFVEYWLNSDTLQLMQQLQAF